MKFATKFVWHYPFHLRHVATLPWEINSSFLQIFSDNTRYGRKCKQIAFQVHRFWFLYACKCVCWVYLCVFIKILSSSLNTMLIVDKQCSDVCCDEFPVPQIDRKNKQVKEQWHAEFYLQSVRRTLAVLNTENTKICGSTTKLEATKM